MTEEPSMYCIKCRSHTGNVDLRYEEITSKGQPRTVLKATCAVCSMRKNRFSKTVKADPEQVGQVECEVKKQRETKVSKKLIESLLQKFIASQKLESNENES